MIKETNKDQWIKQLQTFIPNGFNIKRNDPQSTTSKHHTQNLACLIDQLLIH